MAKFSRYFTVEQANRLLPEVRERLERIQAGRQRLAEIEQELKALQIKARSNGHNRAEEIGALRKSIEQVTREVTDLVGQIQALGVEVKDLDLGLVDFPSLHRGRRVLLCWRLGELEVGFWHEADAGYAGRQPIRPREAPESDD